MSVKEKYEKVSSLTTGVKQIILENKDHGAKWRRDIVSSATKLKMHNAAAWNKAPNFVVKKLSMVAVVVVSMIDGTQITLKKAISLPPSMENCYMIPNLSDF